MRGDRRKLAWHFAIYLCALCLSYSVGAGAPVNTGSPITAIITQVQGKVSFTQSGNSSPKKSDRRLGQRYIRPMQIVRPGIVLHLSAGSTIGLMCSTERWLILEGEAHWHFNEPNCRLGRQMDHGTYQDVVPQGGRIRQVKGIMLLEQGTRAERDETVMPTVLSPRNTSLINPRPVIRWSQIEKSSEYMLKLIGQSPFSIRLDAHKVGCKPDPIEDGSSLICETSFPPNHSGLSQGTTSFLSVGARVGIASPWRQEPESSKIRMLTTQQKSTIETQLDRISQHPVDNITQHIMRANIYVKHSLLANAIEVYRKILSLQASAEIHVMLGDLYFITRLYEFAYRNYQAALGLSQEAEIRAAVTFGTGRLNYSHRNYGDAQRDFAVAKALYTELGLTDEAAAAQRAEMESIQRRPR